jgi:predicted transposase YdaD
LCVLTELRKLRPLFNKKVKTMPVLFDIDFKNDPFYLEGRVEGHEEGRVEGHEEGVKETIIFMIENLLIQNENSIKSIAKISDQTEAFVLSIKRRLIQEGKLSPSS